MSDATIRCRLRAPRQADTGAEVPRQPSRAARMLALAHHIERLVEEEKLASYAAAADALGLTRARISQVVAMLGLSPAIQERILEGELCSSPRRLRPVLTLADWADQDLALNETTEGR